MRFINFEGSTLSCANTCFNTKSLVDAYAQYIPTGSKHAVLIDLDDVYQTLSLRNNAVSKKVIWHDNLYQICAKPEVAQLSIKNGNRSNCYDFSLVAGTKNQTCTLRTVRDKKEMVVASTLTTFSAWSAYKILSNPIVEFTDGWHFGSECTGEEAIALLKGSVFKLLCGSNVTLKGRDFSFLEQKEGESFEPLNELSTIFEQHDEKQLRLAEWDKVPMQLIQMLTRVNTNFSINKAPTEKDVFSNIHKILQDFYNIEKNPKKRLLANMLAYELLLH